MSEQGRLLERGTWAPVIHPKKAQSLPTEAELLVLSLAVCRIIRTNTIVGHGHEAGPLSSPSGRASTHAIHKQKAGNNAP